jgi:hypothetical protein
MLADKDGLPLATPTDAPPRVFRLFSPSGAIENASKNLTGIRDLILVAGAGCYIFGYLLWAFFGWLFGLGVLPVLSAQFIVSGMLFAALVGSAVALSYFIWHLRQRLEGWFRLDTRLGRVYRYSIALVVLVLFFLTAFTMFLPIGSALRDVLKPVAAIWIFSLIFYIPPDWKDFVGLFGYFRWISPVAYYISVFLAVLFSVFVAGITFMFSPQEFGGMKPSCVMLDVEREMLSDVGRAELTAQTTGGIPATTTVVRTVHLYSFFEDSDSIRVKKDSTMFSPLYEISRKIIRASISCD